MENYNEVFELQERKREIEELLISADETLFGIHNPDKLGYAKFVNETGGCPKLYKVERNIGADKMDLALKQLQTTLKKALEDEKKKIELELKQFTITKTNP